MSPLKYATDCKGASSYNIFRESEYSLHTFSFDLQMRLYTTDKVLAK